MLTICNRNTSPIESKMSVLPLDKRIADFQFAFTGQQYFAMQKSRFYRAKPTLLERKTIGFVTR